MDKPTKLVKEALNGGLDADTRKRIAKEKDQLRPIAKKLLDGYREEEIEQKRMVLRLMAEVLKAKDSTDVERAKAGQVIAFVTSTLDTKNGDPLEVKEAIALVEKAIANATGEPKQVFETYKDLITEYLTASPVLLASRFMSMLDTLDGYAHGVKMLVRYMEATNNTMELLFKYVGTEDFYKNVPSKTVTDEFTKIVGDKHFAHKMVMALEGMVTMVEVLATDTKFCDDILSKTTPNERNH